MIDTFTLPLNAFLAPREPEHKLYLAADHIRFLVLADVVIAKDVMTSEESVVFDDVGLSGDETDAELCFMLLVVEADLDADEFDDLVEAVKWIKGRTEFDDDIGEDDEGDPAA